MLIAILILVHMPVTIIKVLYNFCLLLLLFRIWPVQWPSTTISFKRLVWKSELRVVFSISATFIIGSRALQLVTDYNINYNNRSIKIISCSFPQIWKSQVELWIDALTDMCIRKGIKLLGSKDIFVYEFRSNYFPLFTECMVFRLGLCVKWNILTGCRKD